MGKVFGRSVDVCSSLDALQCARWELLSYCWSQASILETKNQAYGAKQANEQRGDHSEFTAPSPCDRQSELSAVEKKNRPSFCTNKRGDGLGTR